MVYVFRILNVMFKNIEQFVSAEMVLLEMHIWDVMKSDVDQTLNVNRQKHVSIRNVLILANTLNVEQMLCAKLITITKLDAIVMKDIAEIRLPDVKDQNVPEMITAHTIWLVKMRNALILAIVLYQLNVLSTIMCHHVAVLQATQEILKYPVKRLKSY